LRGHPQPIDDRDNASHATVERDEGPIRGKPERRFSFHHWRDLQLRERQENRVHSGKEPFWSEMLQRCSFGSDATERVRQFADRVFSLPRIPRQERERKSWLKSRSVIEVRLDLLDFLMINNDRNFSEG
jgi:hypothetical protein